MQYTIILINGREYDITPDERDRLLGKTGLVHIPSLDVTINMTSVSTIEPKGLGKVLDRSKQVKGVLHDGTRVERRFGVWVDEQNPDVRISPSYYPELAGDFVVTPEEFETHIKPIAGNAERLAAMRGIVSASDTTIGRARLNAGGLQAIGGLLPAANEGEDVTKA